MAQRHIPLRGPENLRDLGGYPTADGGSTAWGVAYRSDSLGSMTGDDRDTLAGLGITSVFDLRAASEAREDGYLLPDSIRRIESPMSAEQAMAKPMLQQIEDGDLQAFPPEYMAQGYTAMMAHFPEAITRVVRAVADGQSVLFHCAAGKDRTGVVAMVLLDIAGVSEADIVADYALTDTYRPRHDGSPFTEAFAAQGLDAADFAALWGAPAVVMELTRRNVAERWGTVTDYLLANGVDEGVQRAARARLIAP